MKTIWRVLRLGVAGLVLLGALCACGGSGDASVAGGVGSGGTGLAEGSISGFGSVIVDGVEYDDSAAVVQVENADGTLAAAATRLGQRVQVRHDAQGKAQTIRVMPALLGPVTQGPVAGVVRVLGQQVRIDADTVLAGYARAADIGVGDEVQVHGAWVQQPDGQSVVLQATRLEKRQATAATPLLLTGIAHAVLNATTFRINGADGPLVRADALPAGLVAGQEAVVWTARADRNAQPLPALRVTLREPMPASGETLVLSGPIRQVAGDQISIQGITARADGALLQGLRRGDTTQLTLERVSGEWQVRQLKVRQQPQDLGGQIKLKDMLSGVNWSAIDADQFLRLTVRGTAVRIPAALVASSRCAVVAAPVSVEITAQRGAEPLLVTDLHCSGNAPR